MRCDGVLVKRAVFVGRKGRCGLCCLLVFGMYRLVGVNRGGACAHLRGMKDSGMVNLWHGTSTARLVR